jgi:hypothetical protein
MTPGMDAEGLKLLVRIRLRCHTQSLLRGTAYRAGTVMGANPKLTR